MKILRVLICCLVIIALLPFAACDEKTNHSEWEQLNWQLYGTWIGEDGKAQNTVEFSITGSIPSGAAEEMDPKLKLDIAWPESFRFTSDGPKEYNCTPLIKSESEMFFIGMILSYDPTTKTIVPGTFGIAPEKGYFIVYWDDNDEYLIASTNPNTDRSEIEAFFSNMMTDSRFQ